METTSPTGLAESNGRSLRPAVALRFGESSKMIAPQPRRATDCLAKRRRRKSPKSIGNE